MRIAFSKAPWCNLVHTFTLTQDTGPGRVVGMSFLNGAGYGYWVFGRRFFIPGFSIYIRVRKQRLKSYNVDPKWPHRKAGHGFWKPYPLVLITRNPNSHLM